MDTSSLIKMFAVIGCDRDLCIQAGAWDNDPDRVKLYSSLCKVMEDLAEATIANSDALRIIVLRLEAEERANQYITTYIDK
jgi:hypothetical protein